MCTQSTLLFLAWLRSSPGPSQNKSLWLRMRFLNPRVLPRCSAGFGYTFLRERKVRSYISLGVGQAGQEEVAASHVLGLRWQCDAQSLRDRMWELSGTSFAKAVSPGLCLAADTPLSHSGYHLAWPWSLPDSSWSLRGMRALLSGLQDTSSPRRVS